MYVAFDGLHTSDFPNYTLCTVTSPFSDFLDLSLFSVTATRSVMFSATSGTKMARRNATIVKAMEAK